MVLERVFFILVRMTTHSDTTDAQAAADLAAAEQENEISESVAPEAPIAEAPLRGLRVQAVELAGQVKTLSEQLETERKDREALNAELATLRAKHPISAQIEAAPSAGDKTIETAPYVPKESRAATTPVAPAAPTPVAVAAADGAAPAAPSVAPTADAAEETTVLTFDSLLDGMVEEHRDVVERHIVGLRTALDKERDERKTAQRAVRTAQADIEQLSPLRQQLEQAEQDALDARAQATFFEHAGTNNVKRGSARLAFLAAKDGQLFDDNGSVQWDSLNVRFPDLFEGIGRQAPTGALSDTPVQKEAVVSERPAAAPRASASAGAGGGAPPRRPVSMTSAIRSAAGRTVK
jgi:hypothetical protein